MNQDCRVDLYNLPNCLRSYEKREPKAKDVTYLSDYSIKSWLNLCGFQKKMDVIIHSRSQPWDFSGDLSVAILKLGKQNLRAIVRIRPLAKRNSPVWIPSEIPQEQRPELNDREVNSMANSSEMANTHGRVHLEFNKIFVRELIEH